MTWHRAKRVGAVCAYLMAAAAFGAGGPAAAPAAAADGSYWQSSWQSANIKDKLTADHRGVEVTYVPFGTNHIGVAELKKLDSNSSETKYFAVPATQKLIYPKDAGYPVLDVQAWARYHRIGEWAGRLLTEQGPIEEPEEKEEAPEETAIEKQEKEEKLQKEREAREKAEKEQKEREEAEKEEKPVNPSFFAGINAGYWGSSEYPDLTTLHGRVVRLDTPTSIGPWEGVGLKVIADYAGPYSSSGVSGLNHKAYVERVVNFVKGSPHVFAVEVLNEPGGNWFWGSSSESETNRQSYAQLLIEVHNALVANFGAARPLELASWDGGHDSSNAWGAAWSKNTTALADVDGVTNHPYGGTGSRSSAILGNRGLVEQAESQSHKPIYVTEVGFPTKSQTGDSLAYSEKESAWAIYHFAEWAASRGYVAGITFYGYRDSASSAGYGLERNDGSHKPGWEALREFNEGKPCTVCQ